MHTIFQNPVGTPGTVFEPEAREAEHLFRVFRVRPGERVRLLDGQGKRGIATVLDRRTLQVESVETPPVFPVELHLCCALPRKNKLDDLLPQLPGLGVRSLRPLLLDHSVATGVNFDRWELLLREGCKQSGNPVLPEIRPAAGLEETLTELEKEGITPYFGAVKPSETAAGSADNCRRAWFVGPEGGFSPEEEERLRRSGAVGMNLGPWILRLESAAIAGLALLGRKILVFFLPALLFFAGCGGENLARNPLMKKGDYYRNAGEGKLARSFYSRLLRKYPNSPELHLKLGTVCDEMLDDPVSALFYYENFLRLAPDSPEAGTVTGYRNAMRTRLLREFSDEKKTERVQKENEALRAENRRLWKQLSALMKERASRNPAPVPPAPAAPAVQERFHRIRPGENLSVIAARYHVRVKELRRLNGLDDQSILQVGQMLKIP